jgi:S-adenosylmethionine decarboxylase
MQGLHLTADLYDCQCESTWLTDAARLGKHCLNAVNAQGLQAVGQLFHTFPESTHGPGGVTATEQRAVTLDVYVCNFGADHTVKAHALMRALEQLFAPLRAEHHQLNRGSLP